MHKIAVYCISMISVCNFNNATAIHSHIHHQLSLNTLKKHGMNDIAFTMYCLAAATTNKFSECINQYINKLLKAKIYNNAIITIIFISPILSVVSTALEIKRLRSYEFSVQIKE